MFVQTGIGLRAQNAADPLCQPMAGHFETSMAYQAACDLVCKGQAQPIGYTEPLLHAWRLRVKAVAAAAVSAAASAVDSGVCWVLLNNELL